MNPYNHQPYGYPQQQTPGPPQPPWQAPPRQGWGDPRIPGQTQSPVSPTYPSAPAPNAFGAPLPPPPPPQSHYRPQPPGYDTSQWGVKYNQGLAVQNQYEEPKPPLPPRPPSAAGRFSPQPYHHDYAQQAPATQQYPAWNDPYHANNAVPPPPPPRPVEYQAQSHASQPGRTSTPQQGYSHQPASHHYDPAPPQQPAWHAQAAGPVYQSSVPATQHLSGKPDGALVSPVDSHSGYWGGSHAQANASQAQNNYNAPAQKPYEPPYSQALSFGGPSDWEYFDTNAPPSDQTPTSPLPNPLYQLEAPVSPPTTHSTPAPARQTPQPEPARPLYPVEIGAPSPVTPRRDSHSRPPTVELRPPPHAPPSVDERPSSAGRKPSTSSVRSDSLNGASNIDSVIQAWNTPLKPRRAQDPQPESRASAPRTASPEADPSPGSIKVVDPYADLEPEFKASLKRYAGMLRKEAAADTDEEKFDIFQGFVTKELRLRSLIYGVELKKAVAKEVKKAASLADIQAVLPKSALPPDGASANFDQIREAVRKASLPAAVPAFPPAPPNEPLPQAPVQPNVVPQEPPKIDTSQTSSVVPPRASQLAGRPPLEERSRSKGNGSFVAAARNDQEVYSPGGRPLMVKAPAGVDEETYSPGGRPITTKATGTSPANPTISTTIRDQFPPSQDALSPSANAPMVIEDYVTAQPISPSINAPMVVTKEAPSQAQKSPRPSQNGNKHVVPIKFEPSRPAYTPFRYNTGVQEEKSKTLKPADQAYSSLRNSQAGSGRVLSQDAALLGPARPSSTSGRKEHEEAFIGLIRKQSMAVRQKTPGSAPSLPGNLRLAGRTNTPAPNRPEPPPSMRVGTPATQPIKSQQPEDILEEALAALHPLLPPLEDLPTPVEPSVDNPNLKVIKSKINSIADKFSFIHDAVLDWDRTNRLVRKEQEAERQVRQGESEAHIDDLFNDNEISYADIGQLEADFKLSEAEKKYQEDQAELESFTSQVFVVITERLQKEIAELMTAFTMAIDMLDVESVAVSGSFKAQDSTDKRPPRMTEIMSCILSLFNKIENRHKKLAEAHVERERRRKHLELTVLYTNGDIQAVKQLEKEFAVAEKMAVLHEARGKDNRTNKLMDSFDRATVRGLGDNQVFTDGVLSKLQDLKKAIDTTLSITDSSQKDTHSQTANSAKETLHLAQSTLEAITTNSRRLLALSNEGDVLLNDADFNVSIAEARVANADKAVYKKLEEEKAKEDGKLIEEMNVRVKSVVRGPAEGVRLVKELEGKISGEGGGDGIGIGIGPGTGGDAHGGGGGSDAEHTERMRLALEKAKMRNASVGGKGAG